MFITVLLHPFIFVGFSYKHEFSLIFPYFVATQKFIEYEPQSFFPIRQPWQLSATILLFYKNKRQLVFDIWSWFVLSKFSKCFFKTSQVKPFTKNMRKNTVYIFYIFPKISGFPTQWDSLVIFLLHIEILIWKVNMYYFFSISTNHLQQPVAQPTLHTQYAWE